jgi:uncharacterized PurR-regulated membrane protein YhhQ (DUF165 family)
MERRDSVKFIHGLVSWLLILVYVVAMVATNLAVWWFGPWSSPIIAFLLIGLDLMMRDVMHERLDRKRLAIIVIVGGFITWLVNPAAQQIAVASAIAFSLAALANWIAYQFVGAGADNHLPEGNSSRPWSLPWLIRANGSNVVGAAVDSIVFPTMAFGVFLPEIISLQFVAKVAGGAVWCFVARDYPAAESTPPHE